MTFVSMLHATTGLVASSLQAIPYRLRGLGGSVRSDLSRQLGSITRTHTIPILQMEFCKIWQPWLAQSPSGRPSYVLRHVPLM